MTYCNKEWCFVYLQFPGSYIVHLSSACLRHKQTINNIMLEIKRCLSLHNIDRYTNLSSIIIYRRINCTCNICDAWPWCSQKRYASSFLIVSKTYYGQTMLMGSEIIVNEENKSDINYDPSNIITWYLRCKTFCKHPDKINDFTWINNI